MKEQDVPEPFNQPLELFLTGQSNRVLDIDSIFNCDYRKTLECYSNKALQIGPERPAILDSTYKIRIVDTGIDSGVVLCSSKNEIIGAYIGCSFGIDPQHQGRGLGAELVFEFAYTFGSLPTWFLDVPAYSPAGFAAHSRAWYLARNCDFIKIRSILHLIN